MRVTISPAQRSSFQREGQILFEKMVDPQDLIPFQKEMLCTHKELIAFIKKKQLAEIAYELTLAKPLRLANVYQGDRTHLYYPEDCALFLSYKTGDAFYSRKSEEIREENMLVLIFTARYLDEQRNPTVFR